MGTINYLDLRQSGRSSEGRLPGAGLASGRWHRHSGWAYSGRHLSPYQRPLPPQPLLQRQSTTRIETGEATCETRYRQSREEEPSTPPSHPHLRLLSEVTLANLFPHLCILFHCPIRATTSLTLYILFNFTSKTPTSILTIWRHARGPVCSSCDWHAPWCSLVTSPRPNIESNLSLKASFFSSPCSLATPSPPREWAPWICTAFCSALDPSSLSRSKSPSSAFPFGFDPFF